MTLTFATLLGVLAWACRRGPHGDEQAVTKAAMTTAPASPLAATPSTPARSDAVRGMWVWGTRARLDGVDAGAQLLASCRAAGVDEVYLSVGDVLDDPRLPALVAALQSAGVSVEALMGDATWIRPEGRPQMLAYVDAVAAYDARVSPASTFSAVHLDVEPHQLAEYKGRHAFLPELVTTLALARARASERGLSMGADLPRFALEERGPEFVAAVPRIFLMLYELRDRSNDALVQASGRLLDRLAGDAPPSDDASPPARRPAGIVIGIRADDYVDDLEDRLRALDATHRSRSNYLGWAIHDEQRYRVRRSR